MNKIKDLIWSLSFILIFSGVISGQTFPLENSIFLAPPYPSNFDAYVDYLELGIIEVNNVTANPIEAFYSVSFKETSGKLSVTTDGILGESINLQPGITTFTPMEVDQIFSGLTEENFVTAGISQAEREAILLNRQVPEGTYEICLVAYDINGEALSDPSLGCTVFDVTFAERPIIDLPLHNSQEPFGEFLMISWSHHLNNAEALMRTDYTLKIIDLTQESIDNPQLAMLNPGIPVAYEVNLENNYNITLLNDVDLNLVEGNFYALRVTASDPDNEVAYQFGGHSEISVFQFGKEGETGTIGEIPDPYIINPENAIVLDTSENISLEWGHDLVASIEDDFSYTLKIADISSETDLNSIGDIDTSSLTFIYNAPIEDKVIELDSSTLSSITFNGQYAWFIEALNENEDLEEAIVRSSEIATFQFGKRLSIDTSSNEGGCVSECISPLPINKTAITLKEKDVIRLGKFNLNVIEITGGNTSTGYTGIGEITINFLNNLRIKVNFNEIKVNSSRVVFEGFANAEKDPVGLGKSEEIAEHLGAHIPEIGVETSKELRDAFTNTSKLISKLSGAESVTLPLGWNRDVQGQEMIVGLTEMTFLPTQAEMEALFSMENPDWGEYLPSFAASKIVFSEDGFDKGVTLYLTKDYSVSYGQNDFALKGYSTDGIEQDTGSYVILDCNGFKKGRLSAEVIFSREVIVPDSETGAPGEGRVTARMRGELLKGNHFTFTASIDPFQVPGLEGFSWEVDNAFFDNSDFDSPFNYSQMEAEDEFSFIQEAKEFNNEQETKLWRGFYIQNITMRTPKDWAGDDTRKSFSFQNLIIEKTGITGAFEATEILNLQEGDIEGWAFSIDTFRLELVNNSFRQGRMGGKVGLPILQEGESITYGGFLDQDKDTLSFNFLIKPTEELTVPLMVADLKFDNNSEISIFYSKAEKKVDVQLYGTLRISNTVLPEKLKNIADQVNIEMPGIRFEGLKFGTHSKFEAPTFELVGDAGSLGGFPINEDPSDGMVMSTDDAGPEDEPTPDGSKITFVFAPEVSIVGNKNAITASAKISFVSSLKRNANNKLYYKLESVRPEEMTVDASPGGFKINGKVNFYNSNGFKGARGELTVGIPSGIEVNLEAEFGVYKKPNGVNLSYNSTDFYAYWRLEGLVKLGKAGIPIGVGQFQTGQSLYGFGGGAWYNMTMTGNLPGANNTLSEAPNADIESTGLTYSPRPPTGGSSFGLKATVVIGTTGSPEAFNADVSLLGEFTASGGVTLALTTDAYFMSGLSQELRDNAKVWANGKIAVSNTSGKWVFSGNLDVFVNVTAGANDDIELIKGGMNKDGLMARAEMNITPGDPGMWYFYLGTPERQGSLKIELLGKLELGGYLMVGHGISSKTPKLPEFIRKILAGESTNGVRKSNKVDTSTEPSTQSVSSVPTLSHANTEEYSSGKGFAFGLNLKYFLRETYLGFIKLYFEAQAGFDISLLYNPERKCQVDNTVINPGVDGWYATGQVYAGIAGAVDIHVDLFFFEGDINILEGAAAFSVQGGGPNPEWITGKARIGFKVLGGLVEGSAKFDIDLGEKCEPYSEDAFGGISFIDEVTPGRKNKVNIYTDFTLTLKNKIKRYEFPKKQSDPYGPKYILEPYIAEFKVYDLDRNKYFTNVRPVKNVKNNLVYRLETNTALDEKHNYRIDLVIKAWDYTDGTKKPAKNKDGSNWEENINSEQIHKFRTDEAPKNIPDKIVHSMYPFNKQRFVLQDHRSDGFLKLTKSVDWRVLHHETSKGRPKKYYFKFTNLMTQEVTTSEMVKIDNQYLTYKKPRLENRAIYNVELISKKITAFDDKEDNMSITAKVDEQNLSMATRKVKLFDVQTEDEVELEGVERVLYSWHFATSRHNRIEKKIEVNKIRRSDKNNFDDETNHTNIYLDGIEAFDEIDLYGFKKDGIKRVGPLFKPKEEYNDGYAKFINDRLYAAFYDDATRFISYYNKDYRSALDHMDAPWKVFGLDNFKFNPKYDTKNVSNAAYARLLTDEEIENARLKNYTRGIKISVDIENVLFSKNIYIMLSNMVKFQSKFNIQMTQNSITRKITTGKNWMLASPEVQKHLEPNWTLETTYSIPFLNKNDKHSNWSTNWKNGIEYTQPKK